MGKAPLCQQQNGSQPTHGSDIGNGAGWAFVATGATFGTFCGVYDKGGSGYDRPLNRTDIDTTAASIATLLDLQHDGSFG